MTVLGLPGKKRNWNLRNLARAHGRLMSGFLREQVVGGPTGGRITSGIIQLKKHAGSLAL